MSKNLWRGVVAFAATVAFLVPASPASAQNPYGVVTGTALTFINSTSTITDSIPLTGSTWGTSCYSGFDIALNNTTTSTTTWQVTSFSTKGRFQLGGVYYVLQLTRTYSYSGTVNATWGSLNSATLGLNATIWNASSQSTTATDCVTSTTKCRFPGVSLSLQGTYGGSLHTPWPSDTVTLWASGLLGGTTPPCTVPFTTYSHGSVTGLITAYITGVI